ncbi:MAG: PP2C family protein-serine/threonine phosphatase [Acidimicrobiales bacterium]
MSYEASADAPLACSVCGEPMVPADRWCEVCGAALSTPSLATTTADADIGDTWRPINAATPADTGPTDVTVDRWVDGPGPGRGTCPDCGRPIVDGDGWCDRCPGRSAQVHDHRELVDGPVAAVTDQGSSHWRNEDAVGVRWVEGDPAGFVLVVCDGVSVSQDPHLVSRAAVDSALHVLTGAVAAGGDLGAAMAVATAAAQAAAAAVPYDPSLDVGPGACTFVAAAVRGARAAFASVGDSRAYWVDAHGAMQIGDDDSLATEMMASGNLTAAQVMDRPGAHTLTGWLGVDSTEVEPAVTTTELPGAGLVVLMSDGLWTYAPNLEDMARLIGPVGSETTIALARRLVAFANASGGRDNITVAVGPHSIDGQEGR